MTFRAREEERFVRRAELEIVAIDFETGGAATDANGPPLPEEQRAVRGSEGAGQNAASSMSISDRSVASAIARSAAILGRTFWAKNCAAATLPS